MRAIDLDYLTKNGSIKQSDAQDMHTLLMSNSGITDGDKVISEWNLRSPESPWGADGTSKYISELTDMVVAFMKEKIDAHKH